MWRTIGDLKNDATSLRRANASASAVSVYTVHLAISIRRRSRIGSLRRENTVLRQCLDILDEIIIGNDHPKGNITLSLPVSGNLTNNSSFKRTMTNNLRIIPRMYRKIISIKPKPMTCLFRMISPKVGDHYGSTGASVLYKHVRWPCYFQHAIVGSPGFVDEEEEPPLLEELGIDPDWILQKTLAVLNPFHRQGRIDDANYLLQDSDLAGPVAFCLLLAAFLLLAGSKAHFGYIYGLAVTSCLLMYILLSLMSSSSNITLSSVASVLGYCLLPVVLLAGFSIFTTLRNPAGLIFACLAVAWATLSASRFLSNMSGEENQRLLIAYPCMLLYGVFTLIIVF